jgi:hypothetical protein
VAALDPRDRVTLGAWLAAFERDRPDGLVPILTRRDGQNLLWAVSWTDADARPPDETDVS